MKRHSWILGAALAWSLVMAPTVKAAKHHDYDDQGTRYWSSGRTFVVEPQMSVIPNSHVYYIRDRTNYDMYRFGSKWYIADQGNWFESDSWQGPFVAVSFSSVPHDIATVPADYRSSWVLTSDYEYGNDAEAPHHYADRTFHHKPKMSRIPDTDVYFSREASDYDLYRYHDHYYLVDDGFWYKASSWTGPFARVKMHHVPGEVLSIPVQFRHDWAATTSYREPEQNANYNNASLYWQSGRTFTVHPTMDVIADTDVESVEAGNGTDYDLYHYGTDWYLVDNGGWYHASAWSGPFVSVSFGNVPVSVRTVPVRYRHFWTKED